jgi:hypothetical protein
MGRFNFRKIAMCLLALTIVFGPLIVGVLPVLAAVMLLTPIAIFSLYAFGGIGAPAWMRALGLVVLSICFAVTLFDLLARPVLLRIFEDRPKIMFAHRVPELPEIYRFSPNINFVGRTYGNLAATSGRKDWRENRDIRFVTDGNGYRNDPVELDVARPVDLVILSDSYGVGDGTSQEATWPSVLSREHKLTLYNLSMDGASPWQEFVTFMLEKDRLKLPPNTLVVWTLFTGNDLDDLYLPVYEKSQLPWRGHLAQVKDALRDFRYRSPLRRILLRHGEASPREDVIARTLPDGRLMLFSRAYEQAAMRTPDEVRRHPNFNQLRSTIKAMKKLTDFDRLRLAIVVLPCKEEIYSWVLAQKQPWFGAAELSGFAQVVEELSQANDIQFIDLTPRILAAARRAYTEQSGALLWWRDDTHMNGLGHQAAATAIYDQLLVKLP